MQTMRAKTTQVPAIRFPEFEGEWKMLPLNRFLFESKRKNTELIFTKEDVLSVSGELGIVNQIKYLGRSYAGVSVKPYGIVETGDVVYTKSPLKSNPYGIIKCNKGNPGIVSTLYAIYCPTQDSIGQFIQYYFELDTRLNNFLRPLVRKGAKNDMKVNNAHVLTGNVKFPFLDEQQKIASFFTAVDEKLQQLTNKKALLEQYKKGVMQKIFSQELRFKIENENGELVEPPEWEYCALKDVADINPKTETLPNNFIYIDLESVEAGNLLKQVSISKSEAPSRAQRLLQKGDVLFQMVRPYQQNNYFFNDDNISVASTGYAQIRTASQPKYIYYALHTKEILDEVLVRCTGSNYPAINTTDLGEIELPYPSEKEREKITAFLSAIDEKINHVTTQLQQTRQWKKGLLQGMFV